MAAILNFGIFFRWLTGFIKRAISKEYVCQFWCLFTEMRDFCVFSGGHFEKWPAFLILEFFQVANRFYQKSNI